MKKILLLAFFALSTTLTLFSQTVTSRKIFANPDCNCVTIVSIADTNAVHDIDARAILSIRRVGASNVELTTQSGAVFVFNHVNTFTKDSVRIATTSFGLQKAIRTIVKSLKVILAKSNASGYNATFDVSGLTANRTYTLPDQDATLGSGSGSPTWGSITGTLSSQTDLNNALAARVLLTGSSSLSGDFVPTTTNTSNLGSNANRFLGVYSNNLYASGKAFVGPITSSAYTGLTVDVGLTNFLGGTTTVNGALLPNVSSLNIGGTSSGQHWGNVYATNINNQVGTLNLQSAGNTRLSITTTGQVNIDNPASLPLLVTTAGSSNNTVNIRGTASNGYSSLGFQSSSATAVGGVGYAHPSAGLFASSVFINTVGSIPIVFAPNNTEAARFHSDGNFSLGSTVNAGFRLDVNGTARATQYSIGTISTNFIGGGGFGEINISSSNVDLRVGGPPAIWTFVDNTKDIGTSDRRWRTGFFGTSVISASYRLSALNAAPTSATDTGIAGEIRVTATHIYVCTATNTWVRSALSTW